MISISSFWKYQIFRHTSNFCETNTTTPIATQKHRPPYNRLSYFEHPKAATPVFKKMSGEMLKCFASGFSQVDSTYFPRLLRLPRKPRPFLIGGFSWWFLAAKNLPSRELTSHIPFFVVTGKMIFLFRRVGYVIVLRKVSFLLQNLKQYIPVAGDWISLWKLGVQVLSTKATWVPVKCARSVERSSKTIGFSMAMATKSYTVYWGHFIVIQATSSNHHPTLAQKKTSPTNWHRLAGQICRKQGIFWVGFQPNLTT